MTRLYHTVFVALMKYLALVPNHSRIRLAACLAYRDLGAAVRRSARRALSVALIISLLTVSTPAAAQTVVEVSTEWHATLGFWWRANRLSEKLRRALTVQGLQAPVQEGQEARDARVSKIEIYPGDVTLNVEERVTFAAVAFDGKGDAVGGVRFKWSARDEGRDHPTRISQQGDFESVAAGTFMVMAEGGGTTARVKVTVLGGQSRDRRNQRLVPSRNISSRDLPSGASSRAKIKQDEGHSAHAKKRGSASTSPESEAKATTASPVLPVPPEEGWDDTNYWSADDPGNGRGDPPAHPLDNGAGSSNFQISAPVLGLPGRGIDLSLSLVYNSRLWNKAGTQINYDIDRDWPAPGWSLGFGKVVAMGTGGAMIVDADGTRHGFSGSTDPTGQLFTAHTTDGSLINYQTSRNLSTGAMHWAEVNLPNGTQIHYYVAGPGGVFPTQIIDANGNYITITYVNNIGPRIKTVTDTLGRPINFHYDSNSNLTAVTAPGLGGGTRTLVRLHYRQLSLTSSSYSFSGLTAIVRNPYPWVIDAIYYPGSNTGCWFGDNATNGYLFGNSESYSSYGMLAKAVEVRGMTFSGPEPVPTDQGPTEQGTITSAGLMTRKELYNYPQYVGDSSGTPSSSLTDAPTYTALTESWSRDGSNIDSATTNYAVFLVADNPSHPTIPSSKVEVTLPNLTKSIQYSYRYTNLPDTDPNKALDGVVYQEETRDSGGVLLQSGASTWEKGAYDSPRPTREEATNDRGQTTVTEFTYGSVYNQVTEVRNYGYGGTPLLRATRTTYQNSANYTGRHIFNLPLSTEIYAGDYTTRVSRSEYQYDGQVLADTPGVTAHADNHNPYAPQYPVDYCAEWDYWYIDCLRWEQYFISDYNPVTDYRGNVTQVTTYSDAVSATGPVTENRRYDITGNMVTATSSCCRQASFSYTLDTQYAYSVSQTRGSATDGYAQLTTSGTFDINTGVMLSETDVNGRTAQKTYFADTLRPQTATLPTGAHTDYVYDDAAMSSTTTTYLAPSPTDTGAVADKNIQVLNGRGQVRQEWALAPNNTWDIVERIYDNMGRVSQQSQPYRSGDTPLWTTNSFDSLNRPVRVTTPDGSTTETYYNEKDFDPADSYTPTRPNVGDQNAIGETSLVRDPWGRERWARTDALGRLVEVVEPAPSGSGSVATGGLLTSYSFDTLGNLTGVTQDTQTRSFKYDSLGRLLAQKLAEADATLNNSGAYVGLGGSGAQWSDFFRYDGYSNLVQRTDARGVKTNFWYFNSQGHSDPGDGTSPDPLNRLQSVSYDTSGDPNHGLQPNNPNYYLRVLDTATVNYQYRTKDNPADRIDVTQVASVTSAGIATTSYLYNPEGKPTKKTVTMNSRSAYPIVTDYFFDTLDRITDVYHPGKDLSNNSSRKHLQHYYDVTSRLSQLTVDGQSFASNFQYNPGSQTTSLKVGPSGSNQITENYLFEPQTGLLWGQSLVRGGDTQHPILDLTYQYTDANNKRTGQLTKILNNWNHNKDRAYTYDALGRLSQAKGGPSGSLWTQTYSYDRFGNRLSVSASGNSAKADGPNTASADALAANAKRKTSGSPTVKEDSAVGEGSAVKEASPESTNVIAQAQPADPKVVLPTEQLAAKTEVALPESLRTDAPRSISDSSFHHGARVSTLAPIMPQGGPPVFTDDPLVAGTTVIKAVHVTELRTAVNQARALGGLGAASWTDPTLAGTIVKAVHITELRTGLAGARAALGLSVASYTDPTLTATSTVVKAVHITELRQRVTETLAGPAGCPAGQNLSIDLFVKNFYQAALNRQPNATELQSWSDLLRQAYYQGHAQLLGSAQYLGRQLFQSQEYINRGRSDHDYVYDLYKGYLQREPDQTGWDGWTTQAGQPNGRENVRNAFELSGEFANKVASLCAVSASGSAPIPLDGLANLSYHPASNRISTAGFSYDAAGNQTRILRPDGSAQKFQYDAANRLMNVRDDYAYILAAYTYSNTNERLIAEEGGLRTYFASDGGTVLAEYTESGSSTTPTWSKSYVYLGSRLLSTIEPNGSGGERVQYHHPNRLGTQMVTNPQDGTSFEQVTLPFGTALNAESSGSTRRRFTSYDRSAMTGLDYAINRHYDSQQGRFTQVDPIGMQAVSLLNPQSLNMYAYCGNDPINQVDPNGLFWGKLFRFLLFGFLSIKSVQRVFIAVVNAVATVLNNRWVRIGVFIASFLIPFVGPVLQSILQTALRIYNTVSDIVSQYQLLGLVVQGKVKELLRSIGLSIAGSFIATIENGLMEGLQKSLGTVEVNKEKFLNWKNFSFKKFFSGLKDGFKIGFKDFKHQIWRKDKNHPDKSFWTILKDSLIPGFYLFCGPGLGGGPGEDRDPIGPVDAACKIHDDHYNAGDDRLWADVELAANLMGATPRLYLFDIAFAGRPSIGSSYKFAAITLFGVITPRVRLVTGWR